MKCIANVHCQCRDDNGKIRTFKAGDVFEYAECPKDGNWTELQDVVLNLAAVSLQVLLDTQWHKDDLVNYAKQYFGVDLSKHESKTMLANAFIDARYRAVSMPPVDVGNIVPGEVIESTPATKIEQPKRTLEQVSK